MNAGVYLLERKDRLVEDVRMLRVVIGAAFEGRVDRVNDRVDDYRGCWRGGAPPSATSRSARAARPPSVADPLGAATIPRNFMLRTRRRAALS